MSESVYTVFQRHITCNLADFEIREVMHGGVHMKGVFARREVAAQQCPRFLGVYPGVLVTGEQAEAKRAAYAIRHNTQDKRLIRHATLYNLAADGLKAGSELDPTDADGQLLPKFTRELAPHLNEPPPGIAPNASFAFNMPRDRYEVWLLSPIARGNEVFLCYGGLFRRNYAINDDACFGRKHFLIRMSSALVLDLSIR